MSTSQNQPRLTEVGAGAFRYRADPHWARLPIGYRWTEVSAIAVDSRDRVFVFNRGEHPILLFDQDGNFLTWWEEGRFTRAHGITIGPDDSVYCTDDLGHTVTKFSRTGKLLWMLGQRNRPSDTGATSIDYRTIRHSGPPFHFPTNVALAPDGETFYVSDGYGNARVHRFSADGKLLFSWGEPGSGPGEFQVPHGIAVARDGRVYVADRENSRIQIFSPEGKYLDEWRDVARPCQITIDGHGNFFVAELGYRAGMWPGTEAPSANAPGGRLRVFSNTGQELARWGGGENPTAAGDFFAPHDVCVDSRGNLYVAEVVWSAGGNRGLIGPDCHTLQKFTFIRNRG